MSEQLPPLLPANQLSPSPRNEVGLPSTPLLLDRIAAEARLDPWEVAEAIANTVNHAAGGRPDPGLLADGIVMPHTANGRAGKLLLQRAWLDSLSLPQLSEFRRACVFVERETLAGMFDEVLALFGGAEETWTRATGETD